jgi:CheY-like chemotaxis protein
MDQRVAILEDNPKRVVLMSKVLERVLPTYVPQFVANAPEMIAWMEKHLHEVGLRSLDHDLDSVVPREMQPFDPGCGRDIVNWLAEQPPVCPVLVHTTNAPEAVGMIRVMREKGWPVWRTRPHNQMEWIETDWEADLWGLIRAGWIF